MAKKLITFLGTNSYIHCKYKLNEFESKPVRYVQEAIAQFLCKDWGDEDKIVVFMTKESKARNWDKAIIDTRDKFADKIEPEPVGLEARLRQIGLKTKLMPIEIPNGLDENEIWRVVEKIDSAIDNHDELYIDITHSFRFLPMIIPSILSYLKVTKNITVGSIYYGAFEALGSLSEIIGLDPDKRVAPIKELVELYKMIEWSEATTAFLQYGSGRALIKQIDKIDINLLEKKAKNALSPLKKYIQKIDDALKYNNVKSIRKVDNLKLDKKIDPTKSPSIYALFGLLPKIENYLYKWDNDEVKNGVMAARWCQDNDRFAQSLTFLHESLITFFIRKANIPEEREYRLAITFILDVISGEKKIDEFRSYNEDVKNWLNENIDKIKNDLSEFTNKNGLIEMYKEITDWRNTINHAKPGDRKYMTEKYPKYLEEIEKALL